MSRDIRFPTIWYVRLAKPQISLRIRRLLSFFVVCSLFINLIHIVRLIVVSTDLVKPISVRKRGLVALPAVFKFVHFCGCCPFFFCCPFVVVIPVFFFRKKDILNSFHRPCVHTSVTFLVNVSPPKLSEVATSNFVVE